MGAQATKFDPQSLNNFSLASHCCKISVSILSAYYKFQNLSMITENSECLMRNRQIQAELKPRNDHNRSRSFGMIITE